MAADLRYPSASVLERFVLESMREPVVVVGPDGDVVESNRAAQDARYRKVIDSLRPLGANDQTLAFLDRAWHEGRAALELERPGGAGEAGPLLLEAFGVEVWIVVVIRDDTERRKLEDELRQLRRFEAVGLLTASVIHDFNNLLTPVLALGSTLAAELRASSSLAGFAEDIETVASRSAALLRHLVAMASAQALPVEPIDLSAAIGELIPLIARAAGDQVKLTFTLADQPARALVDRCRLEHALLNLVANARHALPTGGELRISTALAPATSSAEENDADMGHVLLVVSDDGVGMTEATRERASDDFFTTREATGGSGLGLASVKRFIADCGGDMSIASEPERGTTVTLRFPRVEGRA